MIERIAKRKRFEPWSTLPDSRGQLKVMHDNLGFTLVALGDIYSVGDIVRIGQMKRMGKDNSINEERSGVLCARILRRVDESEVRDWLAAGSVRKNRRLHPGWWYEVIAD